MQDGSCIMKNPKEHVFRCSYTKFGPSKLKNGVMGAIWNLLAKCFFQTPLSGSWFVIFCIWIFARFFEVNKWQMVSHLTEIRENCIQQYFNEAVNCDQITLVFSKFSTTRYVFLKKVRLWSYLHNYEWCIERSWFSKNSLTFA